MRRGAKPAKAKSEAKPFATQKSPKDEGARVRNLEERLVEAQKLKAEAQKRLAEALEQQAATEEVLQMISRSPTDMELVFRAVLEKAVRVCGADLGLVFRFSNGAYELAAAHDARPEFVEYFSRGRIHANPDTGLGRLLRTRRPVQIEDVTAEDLYRRGDPLRRATADIEGIRTWLGVPMLKDGALLGAIVIYRREVHGFSDRQVDLLVSFANQAVIAIENVRLFNETKEALERQTATSEILRVISRSPTDVQPVFNEVAQSAARLCQAQFCHVFRFDGALLHVAAHHGLSPEGVAALQSVYPSAPGRGSAAGRAILSGRIEQIPDINADADYRHSRIAAIMNYQSIVAVPMLRDRMPIGSIVAGRSNTGFFPERLVTLLQTFADQAVIAIENVRLFTELQARNRDLTATSEILQVISRSPTDVQPVFTAIARSAAHLTGAVMASVYEYDSSVIHLRVVEPDDWPHVDDLRRYFPTRPARNFAAGRVILDRAVLHRADLQNDPDTPELTQALAGPMGLRGVLWVPMLRNGEPAGVIGVAKEESALFSDEQVRLLQTFADQAVIAIENVRLFNELQARNRELTEALEQQTATSEILRAISQSPTDLAPVLQAVGERAGRLCDATDAQIYLLDSEDVLRLVASHGAMPTLRPGEGGPPSRGWISGRAVVDRLTVRVHDLAVEVDTEFPQAKAAQAAQGTRSAVATPLLREGRPVGAILIRRTEVRPFSDGHVKLLETFADQAVIAIENVRLFKELQARTVELTRSVGELRALGEVGQAISSTLDLDAVLQTIVTRASQLAGTDACSVFEYDEATEAFHLRATHNLDEEVVALARRTPIRKGEGVQGRMAVTRQPVQIPDIAEEDAYHGPLRDILLRTGTRAVLAIPMLREDQLIGGLTVARKTPGEFSPEIIELLRTFATQSALAIQNARLFRELADKSRQLEAASRHKSEFLANMSHELRTPLNAIIGFSEVLAERMFGDLNQKQDEYLKDIYASGQHLLSLINDILDLSKIEAGRMELELTNFDLPQAINNALTLVRERAGRRGIALDEAVDQRLGLIRGDERKIKQVLLNLLSNALKFTPERGRVEVRASVVDGKAEISVTDTGVGIAPEDQEAVFEEFRQVGTTDKKVEGTGLGLTLSRKFIELHGGKIWVKSQVGMGSTFTFTLPLTT